MMQAIEFYLVLPFIYLISLLPFPILYLISDFFYFFLFYIIRYRKKIVVQNLKNSFPEKSEEEIELICKKFYSHLCDLALETFKTLTISKNAMIEHCRINEKAVHLLNKLNQQKKSVILVLGHLGNWEWAGNSFSIQCRHPLNVIYHPLQNTYYNNLVIQLRTRFGTRLIEMKNTFREMMANKSIISATAFIADQTPPPENAYWIKFLNQDTPVFLGTEKIAQKLNYPVVYINVKKKKRGYYEIDTELLCDNPAATAHGEITAMHIRKLEKEIISAPEFWLWSHRRWKHKRKS